MKTPKGQKNWDDRSDWLLLKCAGHIPAKMIAQILGCKVDRISRRAMTQGIPLRVIHKEAT